MKDPNIQVLFLPFYRNHCTYPMGHVSDKTQSILSLSMVSILCLFDASFKCLQKPQHHGLFVATYFIHQYVKNKHTVEKHVKTQYLHTHHIHTQAANNKKFMLEVLQVTNFFQNKFWDTLHAPISSCCELLVVIMPLEKSTFLWQYDQQSSKSNQ